MAEFLEKVNYSTMSMPKAMNRTNPAPLDASAVWTSLEDLKNYAQTNAVAYVGQILSLVEYNAETAEISKVKAYIIKDKAGNVEEVGSATLGDNKSIELNNGVLSVKDFEKRYYKYIAAVKGGEAAHYELTEGWVAGLEPKVVEEDGEMVIGWYEPNPTTAEGVKDQVVKVQGEVEQAREDIDAAEEAIESLKGSVAEAEEAIDNINNALYGTGEGEEAVAGLVEKVETLEDAVDGLQSDVDDLQTAVENRYTKAEVYTKDETYSKEEVDGLVSGVFHFKGTAESFENLPAEKAEGDVYQIENKEYVWNGTEWVELGPLVDLTAYDTAVNLRKYTDDAVKVVADDLDLAEEAIEELQGADTAIGERIDGIDDEIGALKEEDIKLNNAVADLQTLTAEHTQAIADNKGLIEGLTAVDGAITVIQGNVAKNAEDIGNLNTQVGDLTALVGAPAENEEEVATGLYRELEVIQETIEGIVSVGGEANKINQVFAGENELKPVDKKITIPVYNGTADGLVPVISDLPEGANAADYVLSGAGTWVLAADARIGDLTLNDVQHNTVEEFVAAYVADQQMCWEEI